MESQPQNPEFRINPETFTHGKNMLEGLRIKPTSLGLPDKMFSHYV